MDDGFVGDLSRPARHRRLTAGWTGGRGSARLYPETSNDRIRWTPGSTPNNVPLWDVVYGNGAFLSIGEGGDMALSSNRALRRGPTRRSSRAPGVQGVICGSQPWPWAAARGCVTQDSQGSDERVRIDPALVAPGGSVLTPPPRGERV